MEFRSSGRSGLPGFRSAGDADPLRLRRSEAQALVGFRPSEAPAFLAAGPSGARTLMAFRHAAALFLIGEGIADTDRRHHPGLGECSIER